MQDIIDRMRSEEAELERKLVAVRQFLAAYGDGAPSAPTIAAKPAIGTLPRKPRVVRSMEERMDKFGPYGEMVIGEVLKILPADGQKPIRTRDLVEKVESGGVEITGSSKINSLGALMARSSKIKGYGKLGWTRSPGASALNENGAAEAAPDAGGVAAPSSDNQAEHNALFD